MKKQTYLALIAYFQNHPIAKMSLLFLARMLPIIIVLSYTLFLVCGVFLGFQLKWLFIPLAAFIANTLIRHLTAAARPFEQYHFSPLLAHRPGKSFPSRHCTSALVIALTIGTVYPIWGTILILAALLIGIFLAFWDR